jgi:hypothetical protein
MNIKQAFWQEVKDYYDSVRTFRNLESELVAHNLWADTIGSTLRRNDMLRTALGASGGALLGALTGNMYSNAGMGAAIGAPAGALMGYGAPEIGDAAEALHRYTVEKTSSLSEAAEHTAIGILINKGDK